MTRPLKAALIGSGMIADTHLAAMQGAGIVPVGIYSLDKASAARYAEAHHMAHYDSIEDLLAGEADLAAVCTPSGTHTELAVSLMEHGKHAVVEKPVILTREAGEQLLAAEKRTGKICAPISQLRFSETYRAVKGAVERGEFGKLVLGLLSMKYYRSEAYFAGSWRGTKAMDGGGALMNQGIHGVDMLCGLLGYPEKICGHAATLHHEIEVEDTAAASLVFPGGTLGVIDASTAVRHAKPRRLELCGTAASVVMEEDILVSAEGISLTGGQKSAIQSWEKPADISADLHTAQYKNICAAIRGEKPLYYTAGEAVDTVKVILGIYESSQTGKTVFFR